MIMRHSQEVLRQQDLGGNPENMAVISKFKSNLNTK
jgi:hypothetical protein